MKTKEQSNENERKLQVANDLPSPDPTPGKIGFRRIFYDLCEKEKNRGLRPAFILTLKLGN